MRTLQADAATAGTASWTDGIEIEGAITTARPVGVIVRNTADGNLYASLDANTPSYSQLTGAVAGLRDLILFIDDGPADGFASGAYKEITYDGALLVQEVWYADNTKAQKVVQLDVTYTGALPTTEVWQMFDTDGVTVLVTLTDAIVYDGALETSRTRTWV